MFDYFQHSADGGPIHSKSGNLRPLSADSAAKRLIPSSNSGLPDLTRKSSVLKRDNVDFILNDELYYPCVLFTRTAEDRKTRNVWGYPLADTLQETMFVHPYIEQERQFFWRAALNGPDAVDVAMTILFARKSTSQKVFCVDFSAFDASVKPDLVRMAFSEIRGQFQSGSHTDLLQVEDRFLTIPIWTPEGEISGLHGVPSGSAFTNTVDSLVQHIASGYWTSGLCQIQGDDGVYLATNKEIDRLQDDFAASGLKLNEDKSDVFSETEGLYLQRYYHPVYTNREGGYGGVYPISRALNRIKYLENWTDFNRMGIEGSDFFALRTIMILENCKHHPAFESLVLYVKNLDSNGLRYTSKGLTAYSNAMKSRTRAGIFNQTDMRSGIGSFETSKVLGV